MKGSTALIIVIIIIIIAGCAAGGYYVYNIPHLINSDPVEYIINTKFSKPHIFKITTYTDVVELSLPFVVKIDGDTLIFWGFENTEVLNITHKDNETIVGNNNIVKTIIKKTQTGLSIFSEFTDGAISTFSNISIVS